MSIHHGAVSEDTPPLAAGERGPLPLVLGVTGHRDIRAVDVPALEAAVGAAFDELRTTYRSTPLLLLSPLAAGADRLAARVALDRGIPVVVPLPLEQSEYERDFDEAERAEFHALLARAQLLLPNARSSYFVGYVPALDGVTANDAVNVREPERRSRQYAQAGSYVVRNSQILVALWNGVASDAVGGTSQIVEFKREGRAPGFGPPPRPLDRPEYGPVWHIVTPRATQPERLSGGAAFERVVLWPKRADDELAAGNADDEAEPRDDDVARTMYRRIDRFNADAAGAGLATRSLSTQSILAAAENRAKSYQLRTLWALRCLYAAGFLGTVGFVLYAHVVREAWLLGADLVISAGALLAYFFARGGEWQNRYQDYRAIAEGLRVQEQWHAASVSATVADHYLRQHRGELDWIRYAIRAGRLLDDTVTADDAAVPLAVRCARLRAIYAGWIAGKDGQIAYFHDRRAGEAQHERAFGIVTWACAAASIACTVVAAVLYGLLGFPLLDDAGREETALWKTLVVAISLTAVASGLAASYAEKRAYAIHVKRYRRMSALYARAGVLLRELLDGPSFGEREYEAALCVIRDLGEEALLENAAWVMLHRERPLEFVQGG